MSEWIEVAGTASISFGSIQLYCFPHPMAKGYLFKIGTNNGLGKYRDLTAAKNAGLLELEKLGQAILDGVRALPEYESLRIVDCPVKEKTTEEKLDRWHLSILGMDKPD